MGHLRAGVVVSLNEFVPYFSIFYVHLRYEYGTLVVGGEVMISNMGAPGFVLVVNLIFLIVGLVLLYLVITTAVKDGINKSVVGQFIEKNQTVNGNGKSLLGSDLDNDK